MGKCGQSPWLFRSWCLSIFSPFFVPVTGEQPGTAGCGLCFLCCDWMWAHACVISCGTCSSSTLDSAWQSLIAPPTDNYIMTYEQCHACLLTAFGVIGQVTLPHTQRFWLSVTVSASTEPVLSYQSVRTINFGKANCCCCLFFPIPFKGHA